MIADLELGTKAWVDEARRWLTAAVATRPEHLAFCEIYTDPPEHVSPGGSPIGWHVIIDGHELTVEPTMRDDLQTINVDYDTCVGLAKAPLADPASVPALLVDLHNHLAPRTMWSGHPRVITVGAVELWSETFGAPSAPALLLIMGSGNSAMMWDTALCRRLADAGLRVIRYDARDTGLSTTFDFDSTPYTLADMADDAAGLLAGLGIDRAHVVGASMGGMVAQELAIRHPDQVRSLTLVMTTPAVTDPADPFGWTSGLPPMSPRLQEFFASMTDLSNGVADGVDGRAEIAVAMFSVLAGTKSTPDPERTRQQFRAEIGRFRDPASGGNHHRAIGVSRDRSDLIGAIRVPTLVIHGADDPIIPVEHGQALAAGIPGARLLVVDGMGHDMPDFFAAEFEAKILAHVCGTAG